MAAFLRKSNINLSASDGLILCPYKVPSAHLSYYSMFQRTKFVLNHKMGLPYVKQEEISKKKNSHGVLISEFAKRLILLNIKDPNMYIEAINKARMIRNKADYKSVLLTEEKLKEQNKSAHDYAVRIDNL